MEFNFNFSNEDDTSSEQTEPDDFSKSFLSLAKMFGDNSSPKLSPKRRKVDDEGFVTPSTPDIPIVSSIRAFAGSKVTEDSGIDISNRGFFNFGSFDLTAQSDSSPSDSTAVSLLGVEKIEALSASSSTDGASPKLLGNVIKPKGNSGASDTSAAVPTVKPKQGSGTPRPPAQRQRAPPNQKHARQCVQPAVRPPLKTLQQPKNRQSQDIQVQQVEKATQGQEQQVKQDIINLNVNKQDKQDVMEPQGARESTGQSLKVKLPPGTTTNLEALCSDIKKEAVDRLDTTYSRVKESKKFEDSLPREIDRLLNQALQYEKHLLQQKENMKKRVLELYKALKLE